jgi:hypothetical protein
MIGTLRQMAADTLWKSSIHLGSTIRKVVQTSGRKKGVERKLIALILHRKNFEKLHHKIGEKRE